jgi:hypothetical protein
MRSLDTNIAVQRCAAANADRTLLLAIRLTICSDLTEPRGARFSLATDVLPFCGLLLFTRPNTPLDPSK